MALAEQAFQVFLRDVAMSGRDVDDQPWGARLAVAVAVARNMAGHCLANQAFDQGPIQSCDAHA